MGDEQVPPGSRNDDYWTSKEAERLARARASSIRVRMLEEYGRRPAGMTADEAGYEVTGMRGCYWKRVSELRLMGMLERTGDHRAGHEGRMQAVLAITDAGREMLEERKRRYGG